MTWGSFLTRSLSLIVVLPLILNRLTTGEISLWYLFSTIIGLQLLADLGFSPTFSRVIAYGMGGASDLNLKDFREIKKAGTPSPANWDTIEKICSTMRVIYSRLTLNLVILLAIFGTWSLQKPISEVTNGLSAWISWGVILATSTFTLQGNIYSSYLQGVNQIALLRRWEIMTSLGAILTSFLVLVLGGGLLGLILANQLWLVLNILRNCWLCRTVEGGRFKQFQTARIDKNVFESVWPSAWRSSLGVFMSYGIIQFSGILYAHIGSSQVVASYLLTLRLMEMVSQLSQAPLYSKLPLLAKLRSEGKVSEQIRTAKKGMSLSYWTYVIGFVGLGLFAHPLLKLIGSNADFVSPLFWSILGLARFFERYGAMHIQLYSTTNHIIWHTANGVSGVIYAIVSLSLLPKIGVYAFPIGLLTGYLGFYCWYSARYSYQAFGLKFWSFEKSVMIPPLFILLCYTAYSLLNSLGLIT